MEMVIGSPEGRLYAFDGRGRAMPGFPLTVGGAVNSTALLWDIDGDTRTSELLVGGDDGLLYAWSLPAGFNPSGWHRFHANPSNQGWAAGSIPRTSPETYLENLYVYPNPVKTRASAKIRFRAGGGRGHVRIFNLGGDLVQEFSFDISPCPDNEVAWDVSHLASGVYLIRVEISGRGGSQGSTCKAAVIK